jgi:hypothetical protein
MSIAVEQVDVETVEPMPEPDRMQHPHPPRAPDMEHVRRELQRERERLERLSAD